MLRRMGQMGPLTGNHARHRLLNARGRLSERERRRLNEFFAREPLIAGLGPEGRLPRRPARLDAFAESIRPWRGERLVYFDEPTTNGHAERVINY